MLDTWCWVLVTFTWGLQLPFQLTRGIAWSPRNTIPPGLGHRKMPLELVVLTYVSTEWKAPAGTNLLVAPSRFGIVSALLRISKSANHGCCVFSIRFASIRFPQNNC